MLAIIIDENTAEHLLFRFFRKYGSAAELFF
jgi:hypothetical protein